MVRLHPGLFEQLVCRCFGSTPPASEHGRRASAERSAVAVGNKEEGRVQFPDGPLVNQQRGLLVQRDDTALAWRRREFDSRWVH